MKKIIFLGVMVLLVKSNYAQTSEIVSNPIYPSKNPSSIIYSKEGIKWTGLSWREVKELAVREKKYIFLDFYTTWCGPCKMMDEQVFKNDSVGDYFNNHFVNVKVQLDKTSNDNQYVQSWYNDANVIAKEFRIDAFPSFVFLSPKGEVVHQASGYTGVNQFIVMAQTAVKPDRNYKSPYADYDRLVTDYKQGIVRYDRMNYMIQTAQRIDHVFADELSEKYEKYIVALSDQQRFTKEVIGFLANRVSLGKSNQSTYFEKYKKKIDEVMRQKGYAASIIDKVIYNEIVVPFYNEQNKNPKLPMTGMYLNGIEPDYSEADWDKLEKTIRRRYNKSITDRNVLLARIEWYKRHWNVDASCRLKLVELEKYPVDLQNKSVQINSFAWNAFVFVTDKAMLNRYIKWMKKVVNVYKFPAFIDTYANLLYKVGRRDEAITWEEVAVEVTKGSDEYKRIVAQMKRGEPTYGVKF